MIRRILSIVLTIIVALPLQAQQKGNAADLINESQSEGSATILFQPNAKRAGELDVAGYNNPKEFNVRRGMPNFIKKCMAGEQVRVAFIGGSITKTDYMWRNQTMNYISSQFKGVAMDGVNAGIGGTGSDLGACRFGAHVLKYNPDLLFIEFAVNGANVQGVEGIIRQAIKHNPKMDICLVYTIFKSQPTIYARGDIPANIERLDEIAKHYNLPSVHMGLRAAEMQRDGELQWSEKEGDANGRVVFSKDGVHPLEQGGNLYAAAVARAFNAMNSGGSKLSELAVIEPLHADNFERAKTINPMDIAKKCKGWRVVKSVDFTKENKFHDWFENIATGDADSEPLKFTFVGNMIGFHDIGNVDCGAIDIFINGEKYVTTKYSKFGKPLSSGFFDLSSPEAQKPSLSRFSKYCYRLRTQYEMIKMPSVGRYDVEIRVNPEKIDKAAVMEVSASELGEEYTPQRVHIGWILLDGDIVK